MKLTKILEFMKKLLNKNDTKSFCIRCHKESDYVICESCQRYVESID